MGLLTRCTPGIRDCAYLLERVLASAQRFYRFSDWVHFLGFVFLGILFGTRSGNFNLVHTFEVVVASSLLLAFAYSFNVLCDSELESSVRLSRKAMISDHSARTAALVLSSRCGVDAGRMVHGNCSSRTLGFAGLGVVLFSAAQIESHPNSVHDY